MPDIAKGVGAGIKRFGSTPGLGGAPGGMSFGTKVNSHCQVPSISQNSWRNQLRLLPLSKPKDRAEFPSTNLTDKMKQCRTKIPGCRMGLSTVYTISMSISYHNIFSLSHHISKMHVVTVSRLTTPNRNVNLPGLGKSTAGPSATTSSGM